MNQYFVKGVAGIMTPLQAKDHEEAKHEVQMGWCNCSTIEIVCRTYRLVRSESFTVNTDYNEDGDE